ncbi:hypothetical protein GIB67_028070, partial [Kingdonia uniflora]
ANIRHPRILHSQSLDELMDEIPTFVISTLPEGLDKGNWKSNDGDDELFLFIPFISDVKIKSISVVGGSGGTSPSKMKVLINRDGINFQMVKVYRPFR